MKESYFYQALKQVAGSEPPEFMKSVTKDEYINRFSDRENDELQSWAIDESNLPWCTGMGVIEAAIALVKDAAENANIDESKHPEHSLCLSNGSHMFVSFSSPSVERCNWCGCLSDDQIDK